MTVQKKEKASAAQLRLMMSLAEGTDAVLLRMAEAVEIRIIPEVEVAQMPTMELAITDKEILIRSRTQIGKRHGILKEEIFIRIFLPAADAADILIR